jgi:hypothetical protein
MVAALQDILPDDRDKRAIIERAFAAHPETAEFVRRTIEHIEAMWPNADVELQSHQYDDWDPPVTIEIFLEHDLRDYLTHFKAISSWMVAQPGYNSDIAIFDLHQR